MAASIYLSAEPGPYLTNHMTFEPGPGVNPRRRAYHRISTTHEHDVSTPLPLSFQKESHSQQIKKLDQARLHQEPTFRPRVPVREDQRGCDFDDADEGQGQGGCGGVHGFERVLEAFLSGKGGFVSSRLEKRGGLVLRASRERTKNGLR